MEGTCVNCKQADAESPIPGLCSPCLKKYRAIIQAADDPCDGCGDCPTCPVRKYQLKFTLTKKECIDAFNDSLSEPDAPPDEYAPIRRILDDAFHRMTTGKGHARHGEDGVPLDDQIGMLIIRLKLEHPFGQIVKKAAECQRVTPEHAIKELQDIILIASMKILNLQNEAQK